jgi:hypothetical protein
LISFELQQAAVEVFAIVTFAYVFYSYQQIYFFFMFFIVIDLFLNDVRQIIAFLIPERLNERFIKSEILS